ncbi:MAG: N-acetyltransferase [Candidatus Syntropharchaeales archaeon]
MIRRAKVPDVPAIKKLIDAYAAKNLLLQRSMSDLYENLRSFFVYIDPEGKVTGCCALHIIWGDLGEIRSLAVEERLTGEGVGQKLLEAAITEAKELGLEKVFTLTLSVDFFKKCGFSEVAKDTLPHKVWGWCLKCPKFPDCDEVALAREL